MYKQILLLSLVSAIIIPGISQQRTCYSTEVTAQKRAADSKYDQMMELTEQAQRDFVNSGQANAGTGSRAVRTIPVVFHVVYNTAAQNVSTTLIQQTVAQLNLDFRKLNSELAQARSVVQPFAVDAQIEFCLAQQTPTGQSTNGIDRVSTTKTCWDPNTEADKMKSAATGGANPWDPYHYLNIWVVNLCGTSCSFGGTVGYAYLPTFNNGLHGSAIDGIVLQYCLGLGTGNTSLTHEIGHYLGLHHTWGDLASNACGNVFPGTDDGWSDTPDSEEANFGCSPVTSCPGNSSYGDLYEDYMDYSNCTVLFTTQQANWMNNILTNVRSSLFTTNVCSATGAPLASFTANPTSICTGQTVTFTNTSTGSGNTYSWTFTGGTPSSSTATNPTVTYNTPGTYSVTLTATNGFGNNTSTQTNLIVVSGNNALPLSEGFESATFPPTGWSITNSDASTTWVRTTSASGFGTSSACAYVNNYNYNAAGQKDWLITPAYNFTGVTAGRIKWDYAYAPYTGSPDSLDVLYSTNCGASWTSLWKKGGSGLATASTSFNNFTPSSGQWKKDSVSLASLAGQASVRFAFKNACGYGNNIFIDNINIYNSVTVPQAPVADFIGTPTTVVVGNTVAFTDISSNIPTGWSWTFAGGTPGTSTAQNPTITYNTVGTYTVTLTASNAIGNNTATKTGYITVIQAGGQICDTLQNTSATDTPTIYLVPTGLGSGYLSGNNSYGDIAKAEFYTNSQSRQVTGAYYLFGWAVVNGTGTIQACVWDASGAGGSPGAAPLASVAVNISTIIADIAVPRYTFVSFPTAPTVTGNFYVGYILPTGAGDTVVIATTRYTSPSVGQGWEQYNDGMWHNYNDYWGQVVSGFEVSNYAFPVICSGSGTAPTASFTGNPTAVCVGSTVNFTSTSTGSPTSYSWTFSGGTPSVSSAQNPVVTYNTAGTYSVTLSASNGSGNNTFTQNSYITVYPKPSLTTTATPVLCFGGSTGSATVTPTGGTPAYTYAWSGGGNTASISNKTAGTYTVTVSDSHQCSATASSNIGQPLSALSLSPNASDAICNQPNGTVSVAATGGAGGYVYLWNTNATTASVSNVSAGTYSVTVTDANSCSASASMTVSNATSNFSVSINAQNATCGLNNGSAVALPNNGNFGVTYQWNTGATSGSLSALASGTYFVTVTNNSGCTATASTTITGPGTAVSVSFTVTPAACGQSNGAVTAAANGGSGSYTYLWNTSATTAIISNLPAGNYSVTVNDNAGCSVANSTAVTNTGAPGVTLSSQNPTALGNDGSVTATATGGAAPYTYLWSNGGTTATISNLVSGIYSVTITDNAGCIVTSSTTITGPTGLVTADDVEFIKVFPNPAKDVFNIQIQLSKAHPLDLEILNQLGQRVWAKHFNAYTQGIEGVDVSKLARGVYFLKVRANLDLKTVRFVKE